MSQTGWKILRSCVDFPRRVGAPRQPLRRTTGELPRLGGLTPWILGGVALTLLCSACTTAKESPQQAPHSAPADAPTLPLINATQSLELRAHRGQTVRVQGRVRGVSTAKGGNQFLHFYSSDLSVICFREDAPQFREMPFSRFVEKDIVVRGRLDEYKGKPQIRVSGPDQFETSATLQPSDAAARDPESQPAIPKNPNPKKSPPKTQDQIRAPSAFVLREMAAEHWVSPAGLHYRGHDPDGRNRKEHILRHSQDDEDRPGPHGVFDAQGDDVFRVIDQAWQRIDKLNIRPSTEGNREAYTVRMGQRVGFLGGTTGRERGHPALDRIFIVVEQGTSNVVTAFPK